MTPFSVAASPGNGRLNKIYELYGSPCGLPTELAFAEF